MFAKINWRDLLVSGWSEANDMQSSSLWYLAFTPGSLTQLLVRPAQNFWQSLCFAKSMQSFDTQADVSKLTRSKKIVTIMTV